MASSLQVAYSDQNCPPSAAHIIQSSRSNLLRRLHDTDIYVAVILVQLQAATSHSVSLGLNCISPLLAEINYDK
jgi:hypothetical protein